MPRMGRKNLGQAYLVSSSGSLEGDTSIISSTGTISNTDSTGSIGNTNSTINTNSTQTDRRRASSGNNSIITTNTATTASTSAHSRNDNPALSPEHSITSTISSKRSKPKVTIPSIPAFPARNTVMIRHSSSPVPPSQTHSTIGTYAHNGIGTHTYSQSHSQQQQQSHQQHQHQSQQHQSQHQAHQQPMNQPRTHTPLKNSHSMLLNRNTSAGALSPRVPMRQTASSMDFGGMRAAQPTQQLVLPSSTPLVGVPDQAPKKPSRVVKASEPGKGTLLPDFYSRGSSDNISGMGTNSGNSNGGRRTTRRRADARREAPRPSKSSSSLASGISMGGMNGSMSTGNIGTANNNGNGPHSPVLPTHHILNDLKATKQSQNGNSKTAILRRRAGTAGTSSDDDEDGWGTSASGRSTRSIGGNSGGGGGGITSRISPYRLSRARARRISVFRLSNCRLGHVLQLCIVLAVGLLVWESHHKALFAAQQLDQFKEEESFVLLHLQEIERQSIQLHENLSRWAQAAKELQEDGEGNIDFFSDRQPIDGDRADIDVDLIEKQKKQLYRMEEEINHKVNALEKRIQQSARAHIIQEFGEGPVQVNLELDFSKIDQLQGDDKTKGQIKPQLISILLFHDTPHAAWTWLEQIGRHVWDGAEIAWSQAHVVDVVPSHNDPAGSKIEFIEKGKSEHQIWTVGLRGQQSGGLAMYINLQDNKHYHKRETCVGKVISGFETLQRVLEISRSQNYDISDSGIHIKLVTATHVAMRGDV